VVNELSEAELDALIDETESGIIAICVHGKHRQAIPILDLPWPDPPPQGAEWITAYRHWAG
jgi:hypothetical protein